MIYKKRKMIWEILLVVALLVGIPSVSAAADFAVNTFSCTPAEIVINDVFSCTAQIKNNGDAAGTVSVATLYPDANDWLEDSNYPQASGTSVDPGQTTEVTFTGLRSVKSGDNGFARITLDDVTDTYVSDNNVEVNVIDVIVTVSNSVSSAVMGASFDTSAEVTAGGNIDATLTFTVNSGGCSIGSQSSSIVINDMQNGNKQSKTWSVTQGTTGNCRFTISAAATGVGGVASKIDSTPSTITCTNCPTPSSSSSSSSGGGGGGGAGGGSGGGGTSTGAVKYTLGELKEAQVVDLAVNEAAEFEFSGVKHMLTVKNLSNTRATIEVQSETQSFALTVEENKTIDWDSDRLADISVKLKSIDIIASKARLIIRPLAEKIPVEEDKADESPFDIFGGEEISRSVLIWIIIAVLVLVCIVGGYLVLRRFRMKSEIANKIKVKRGKDILLR